MIVCFEDLQWRVLKMTDTNPKSVASVFKRWGAQTETGWGIGLTLVGGFISAASASPAAIALTVAAAASTGHKIYKEMSLDRR